MRRVSVLHSTCWGPFNKTKRENTHIVLIVDHFTKYAMPEAIKDTKSETIADVVATRWVPIFGAPRQLHTDRGQNVDGSIMRELCLLLQIEKKSYFWSPS